MSSGTRAHGLIVAALLGASWVMLDRLLLLYSSGHLLFDVNQAEYGYLGAIIPWLSTPVTEILANEPTRARFFRDCLSVGNQVHGSLGLAGSATLAAAQWSGSPLSTTLIRALGLGQSMLALLLWCRALGVGTRSAGVVFAFCLLWGLAPLTFTKVTMLWWGTHDTVTLLSSVWVAVLLPWLSHPGAGLRILLRGAVLGLLAGALVMGNYSLLMPTLGGLLFWGAAHLLRARELRELLFALIGLVLAGLLMQVAIRGILAAGIFEGLGYPRSPSSRHFLMLSGKGGRSFLHATSSDWLTPSVWGTQVWPVALSWSPGAAYGPEAGLASGVVRLGAVGAGLWLVLRWLAAPRRANGGLAWLGLYLPLAWIGISVLALGYSPDLNVHAGPQPRYFAHLYPVALAILAVLCVGPGPLRWLRMPMLLWPLWLGGYDHVHLIDLPTAADRVARPLEVAPLYFRARPERRPPVDWDAWPEATEDFVAGYAALERFQFRRYWEWHAPARLHDPGMLNNQLREAFTEQGQPEAYWLGLGTALRVLIPPARVHLIEQLDIPEVHRPVVVRGYNR